MTTEHRILIADDDRALRSCVVELLSRLPVRLAITEVETGSDALSFLRRERFHLALLDFHMPGQNGLEVLTQLRIETRSIPCIMISGDASEPVRKQAIHEGAWAVLKKPVEPKLLRDEVSRALRIEGHAA